MAEARINFRGEAPLRELLNDDAMRAMLASAGYDAESFRLRLAELAHSVLYCLQRVAEKQCG